METAAGIAESVRGGRSAVEVARAHLERIAELNGRYGAFVEVREAAVLAAAERVDRHPERSRLPLAGVPVAVKDNVDVEGYATRHGSAAHPDTPAAADDELVRRLRQAGAVVIGKTAMPELAVWGFTEPRAFPPARNPWDPERIAGGSTGGGAVAVATGMAPLALGSDGGGSIRLPAAACGVFGLKPAPGLVPLAGGLQTHWLGLSAYGPLARSVEDASRMLDVLAGTTAAEEPARRLRVAVSARHPVAGTPISAEVRRAVRDTGAILEAEGHQVSEAEPPYPADLALRFTRRWFAGVAEDAAPLEASRLEPRTRGMARAGRFIAARGWASPAEADPWREALGRWFAEYDVLVMATTTGPAPRAEPYRRGHWLTAVLRLSRWAITPPWNLAGMAAASLPAGLSADGLPLAVQLVAPAGRERVLLEVARRIEARRAFPQWGSGRL